MHASPRRPASREPAFPDLSASIARHGITIADLSHVVGCHSGYLSQILHGHARPSSALRARIAESLGQPESELFGGDAE